MENKILKLKELFASLNGENKIRHLIELGRALPPFPVELKIKDNIVSGCQSMLYLSSRFENNKIYFEAFADALISQGLAALLISVYSGESPQAILKTPPVFLKELGLIGSLTPSRSNGLAHIHQRMKQDALKYLLLTMKSMELNSVSS
jgi:cysteine desulfuration protein SufE